MATPDLRRHVMALAAIAALAVLLRAPGIAEEPLWHDEAMSATWTTGSLQDLASQLCDDVQLPLYYVLEWTFLAALGDTEPSHAALRWPTILFDVATLLALAALGAAACSRRAGLLAAFLFAITPIAVHYAREVRPYSLVMLLVTLATCGVLALERRVTAARVLLTALACVALHYSHGVAPFLLAPLLGIPFLRAVLARDARRIRALLTVGVLVAAGAAAWLPVGMRQATGIGTSYAWAAPHWHEFFPWQMARSLAALSPGGTAPIDNLVRSLPAEAWVGAVFVAGLAALGVAARGRWRMPAAAWTLAAGALSTLTLLFVAGVLVAPIYVIGRSDTGVLPWLVLLTGAGIDAFARRVEAARSRGASRVALAATLVVAVALALPGIREEHVGNHRLQDALVVATLSRHAADGDVVIFAGTYRPTLEWYLPRWDRALTMHGFPASRDHVLWVDWSRHPEDVLEAQAGAIVERSLAEARARGTDVWLLAEPRAEHVAIVRTFRARGDAALVEEFASGEVLLRVRPEP